MGEFRDAVDTLLDLKAEFAEIGIYPTKRSISASAMDGTANFPVLVDDTLSLDDALLISRGLEKKFASFLTTVLTMDPYLEVTKGQTPSASRYLHQFHQNIRTQSPDKGAHISLVNFLQEATDVTDMEYSAFESEAFRIASAIYEGVTQSIPQNINAKFNYVVSDCLVQESLNDKFRTPMRRLPMMETRRSNYAIGKMTSDELARALNAGEFNIGDYGLKSPGDFQDFIRDARTELAISPDFEYRDGEYHRIDFDTVSNPPSTGNTGGARPASNPPSTGNTGDKSNPKTKKTGIEIPSINNNFTIKMPKMNNQAVSQSDKVRLRAIQWKPLTDNDCKKANDLVPTLLHVRVYPIDKFTREEYLPIDFIIGVKATLHPIPVDEITRMIIAGMRNENTAFNFIRWTTGEIKFWKDFVFAVDKAKMDAKDAGGDVTGWRPALKKRRLLSKSRVRLTPASILPNATLVISQPTIENILETYGYNLADQMIRDRMMDVYFLLAYVIANPVTKRVTFKFDGFKATDTYTYDTLQRETSNDDKAFKNMMKMLGRSM